MRCKKRTDGLSVFLVDMREAVGHGADDRPIRTMMNHATTELFFDNLRVPAANLIGEEGKGFRYILDGMNAERILIAAECVGDAHWFIEQGRRVRQRARGVRPADRQEPGRAVSDRARLCADARRRPDGAPGGRACSMRGEDLRRGGEHGEAARRRSRRGKPADVCLQTHGGFGFAEEYDIERKFRETRLYQVAPISTNLILSYVAEHVLGLPRSY